MLVACQINHPCAAGYRCALSPSAVAGAAGYNLLTIFLDIDLPRSHNDFLHFIESPGCCDFSEGALRMRTVLARTFSRLAQWLHPKAVPQALTGSQWSGTGFVDAYKRDRNPTPNEQLAELKNTAFTCASINAAVCAAYAPRLYVATHPDQPAPKCLTRGLDRLSEERLRSRRNLPAHVTKARQLQEVLEHPLLTLLQKVNPVHNRFDLWELTTFYQEVLGSAYWLLRFGPLGVPREIWILPAQNVAPKREPHSQQLVDYYEYRNGS